MDAIRPRCLRSGPGTFTPPFHPRRYRLGDVRAGYRGFLTLAFPSYVATTGLDQSWNRSLELFLQASPSGGVDYVFGPLGHFVTMS